MDIIQLGDQKESEIQSIIREHQDYLSKVKEEYHEVLGQRNVELDKNLKIGEIIDSKDEKITQLEKDLQRKSDESELRREVIESM